jgi:hypothetical protein
MDESTQEESQVTDEVVEEPKTSGLKTAFEKAMEAETVIAEEKPAEEAPAETTTEETNASWPFTPQPMYGAVDVTTTPTKNGTAIVVTAFTPSGALFFWLSNDDARDFASRLKKAANS